MRKIKLYIATSLNGKIARQNGEIDWLDSIPNPDKNSYGYEAFYDSIDTTIQGYHTYQQVLDWGIGFPYAGKKNYVLTRKQDLPPAEHVEFVTHDHIDFLRELKTTEGGDIWLIGGGQVNTLLLNAGLIDELLMFVMPIILPDGIDIFEALPRESHLKLTESRSFPNGVIELNYQIMNETLN